MVKIHFPLTVICLLFTGGLCLGDVIVEENVFGVQVADVSHPPGSLTFDVTLSASSDTVLLIGTTTRFSQESVSGVTVDGVGTKLLLDETGANAGQAAIWAIGLGTVSAGNVTIETSYIDPSPGTDVSVQVVQLSGAVPFAAVTDTGTAGSANPATVTLADAPAGSYVFSVATYNRDPSSASLTGVSNLAVGTGAASNNPHGYGYGGEEVSEQTTFDITYDPTGGNTKGTNMAGIALQAIPEPATASLLGLAALGLLARRRRV